MAASRARRRCLCRSPYWWALESGTLRLLPLFLSLPLDRRPDLVRTVNSEGLSALCLLGSLAPDNVSGQCTRPSPLTKVRPLLLGSTSTQRSCRPACTVHYEPAQDCHLYLVPPVSENALGGPLLFSLQACEWARLMVSNCGVDVNVVLPGSGACALHSAICHRHEALVRYLVEEAGGWARGAGWPGWAGCGCVWGGRGAEEPGTSRGCGWGRSLAYVVTALHACLARPHEQLNAKRAR